ncbi:uncharacterized protein LOC117299804 [Asterias rubens]|uniref:uncharacterized protein LOC117299804 n=1 Tax=Asterias rubens TaxID=7604 RepID=UPI001454FE9B|nr:uncharacterized protein LOC117299804 [Asterias rubens]
MVESVGCHRPICVIIYTTVVALSLLPSGYWAAPFPVDTGRKVCDGLPTDLHGGKVSLAGEATKTGDQLMHTQSISLGRYTPGQHVIVSVLESLTENDGELQSKPCTYALQALDDDTGDPIGRFKTVTMDTRLHHCGALTLLQDVRKHARNGAVFGWLPPHDVTVKDVTVYVRKLTSG